MSISINEQIRQAAHTALENRHTITPRDVYYELCYQRPGGGTAPERVISLLKISRVMTSSGFIVVRRRARGYSEYSYHGEEN